MGRDECLGGDRCGRAFHPSAAQVMQLRQTTHSPSRLRQQLPALPQAATPEPEVSAQAAGLRYVSDGAPGLRRLAAGKGFRYVDAQCKPVRERATVARIQSLAIPPAWREVWTRPSPNDHLQATGLDDCGRVPQVLRASRYHRRLPGGKTPPGTEHGRIQVPEARPLLCSTTR
jgi:hypothetical protein